MEITHYSFFFLSGFDRSLAFPFQEVREEKKKKSPFNAARQTAASAASLSGPDRGLWGGDQFDSLIKDFHSAFVDATQAVRRRHGSGM